VIPVVLDTNVLISALLSVRGNEARVVTMIQPARIDLCISEPILTEYSEVLFRPKSERVERAAHLPSSLVQENACMVIPGQSEFASPDPGDTEFIDCAGSADVMIVATGNKRHFPETSRSRVEVVNARTLLERLGAV